MFEQHLLPRGRVGSNVAHHRLPVTGCAHPALLHFKENKNPCEFKVCQISFQGWLDFTFWLALYYLHDMLSM